MIIIVSTIPCHYCHSHLFQTKIFTTLNYTQNIFIIRISHNNRMSLYGYFCIKPIKIILRDVLEISYFDNIKTWMKY